jgi:hypothetical protein
MIGYHSFLLWQMPWQKGLQVDYEKAFDAAKHRRYDELGLKAYKQNGFI